MIMMMKAILLQLLDVDVAVNLSVPVPILAPVPSIRIPIPTFPHPDIAIQTKEVAELPVGGQ
jgi:hypothetical protein